MDATKAALHSYLTGQREHVLGIVAGLDAADLTRPVLPTGWSCLGLVQHLALDVERLWFREVLIGEQDTVVDEGVGESWTLAEEPSVEGVLGCYRRQIARADEIIAATPLETPPAAWPEDAFGDWRMTDLRQFMLHVITETACHAGHLDAARELIDGETWLVLD